MENKIDLMYRKSKSEKIKNSLAQIKKLLLSKKTKPTLENSKTE